MSETTTFVVETDTWLGEEGASEQEARAAQHDAAGPDDPDDPTRCTCRVVPVSDRLAAYLRTHGTPRRWRVRADGVRDLYDDEKGA